MHGVRREKTSEEILKEKKAAEKKKIDKYCELTTQLAEATKDGNCASSTLDLSAKILEYNPEYYTAWNVRRKVFEQQLKEKTAKDLQTNFEQELKFLEQSIMYSPKSYWVWHHRQWIVTSMDSVDWKRELGLCKKLFNHDERNFHCWNYRRFVANRFEVPISTEFDFTTEEVQRNFSNYSAWHQRSALLPQMCQDPQQLKQYLLKEFELVQNAFYVEPNDSACWFYHQWLIEKTCGSDAKEFSETEKKQILETEMSKLKELGELEPNNKWIVLTMTLLMKRMGGFEQEITQNLSKLSKIDPDRSQYFKDISSKLFAPLSS